MSGKPQGHGSDTRALAGPATYRILRRHLLSLYWDALLGTSYVGLGMGLLGPLMA